MPLRYLRINIQALIFQYALRLECMPGEVSKTYQRKDIRQVCEIRSFATGRQSCLVEVDDGALCRRNDRTTQDHHDQESRALTGVFTQAGNCQREDTWPHDRAAKTAADDREVGDHTRGYQRDQDRNCRQYRNSQQQFYRLFFRIQEGQSGNDDRNKVGRNSFTTLSPFR